MTRPVVIVSNRGPVSFETRNGESVPFRSSGGLVSSLSPLAQDGETLWISAALSEGDRQADNDAIGSVGGIKFRSLAISEDILDGAYNIVSNETLWYAFHGLFDSARSPVIDTAWYDAWSAYRRYNEIFSEAILEDAPEDAVVLVQDHHLALTGPRLRDGRPDISSVHFTHTPFANPDQLRVLPELARTELLLGYLGHDALGFQSSRWSDNFVACSRETLGVRPTKTFISPLGPDAHALTGFAKSPACEAEYTSLREEVGDRKVIARPERLELSKNLLRGFWAFDELLAMRPDLHGEVVFVSNAAPSRSKVGDYIAYRAELERAVEEINARWGSPEWTPILHRNENNYARAIAILRRYDVLLINPIRDGLNLVAKEGPLVNERNGVLLLSREAGAFDDFAGIATEVHPYDITQTAQAMSDALDMPEEQRVEVGEDLREIAASRDPQLWLDEQIDAVKDLDLGQS